MFISVVVPVYNVSEELLSRCLNSVLTQIDENDEIVIIDDGSIDDNSEIYRKISRSDQRIKYIRQENSGPSCARNNGVKHADGDYVLFLDSDDYLIQGCIDQAKNTLVHDKPDILFGYVYKDLCDEGNVIDKQIDNNPDVLSVNGTTEISSLVNHILGYENNEFCFEKGYISDGPIGRFFRKELFINTEFDLIPRWNEDTLWNIEILRKCKKVLVCKSLWYIYAVRKGSATQGYRSNCIEEFNYITKKVSEVGHSIWNGNIDKGIAYRVWHDIFILSRSWIYNDKNTASSKERYSCFKDAVKSTYYQDAVSIVDFKFEKRKTRKLIKQMLNLSFKCHFYHIAYLIIKIYVGNN